MNKLTFQELRELIQKHNEEGGVRQQFADDNPLKCVVVYKASNWPDVDYDENSRSYKFRSDNKAFLSNMIGRSIFADCLDGKDSGVRLDYYDWEVEYCYILN